MRTLLVAAAILVAGCSKKATDPGPSCAAVTDHMLEVTKQQLTGHGEMQLGNRQAMIDQCEQRKMPAKHRACLMAAKDLTAIANCQAGKAPEARPEAPKPTPTVPPVPTTDPTP